MDDKHWKMHIIRATTYRPASERRSAFWPERVRRTLTPYWIIKETNRHGERDLADKQIEIKLKQMNFSNKIFSSNNAES